jgi:K+-sensing histidine kinase KdpD
MALWGTGCAHQQRCARKEQADNAAAASNTSTAGVDKQIQCEQQLRQAEQEIQDLTNELRVTYMELEQEQVKGDALIEENQNLSEQLQALMKHLMATDSKPSAPEKAPGKS